MDLNVFLPSPTISTICVSSLELFGLKFFSFIHSFHWDVQNATIPCHSQELLPFLSVTYFFLPPFSTNYSSVLPHFILPSTSWSTSQSCCSPINILYSFGNSIFFILCTCPNHRNLFNLIVSVRVGFLTTALISLLVNILKFPLSLSHTGLKILQYTFISKSSFAFYLSLLVSRFLMHILTFCLLLCSLVLILISLVCFN